MLQQLWDSYIRSLEETDAPGDVQGGTAAPSDNFDSLSPTASGDDTPQPTPVPKINNLRNEFNPLWILWICVVLLGLYTLWIIFHKWESRRRRDYETAHARDMLGDMQMVPSDDDFDDHHDHRQDGHRNDNELI